MMRATCRTAREGMDGQVDRHSIYVGIGYVGSALAAILAFVTLGVGLQNLALVFGALSVGIGLGPQGVVSNFLSGLILLAPRPVRVLDDQRETSFHEWLLSGR